MTFCSWNFIFLYTLLIFFSFSRSLSLSNLTLSLWIRLSSFLPFNAAAFAFCKRATGSSFISLVWLINALWFWRVLISLFNSQDFLPFYFPLDFYLFPLIIIISFQVFLNPNLSPPLTLLVCLCVLQLAQESLCYTLLTFIVICFQPLKNESESKKKRSAASRMFGSDGKPIRLRNSCFWEEASHW